MGTQQSLVPTLCFLKNFTFPLVYDDSQNPGENIGATSHCQLNGDSTLPQPRTATSLVCVDSVFLASGEITDRLLSLVNISLSTMC